MSIAGGVIAVSLVFIGSANFGGVTGGAAIFSFTGCGVIGGEILVVFSTALVGCVIRDSLTTGGVTAEVIGVVGVDSTNLGAFFGRFDLLNQNKYLLVF
ncbi:MAG: hypothetical protein GPJ52_16340 [Candidatus Heimdallarchaeota archaeon]|nr:hypothetical protein [Candidatus Heimdallarchaeota archaeon]